MRFAKALVRALTILIVALVAGVLALSWVAPRYPPPAALPLTMAGRFDSPCGVVSSLGGIHTHHVVNLKGDEMRRRSRLITRDANFDLWATPLGQYWVPSDVAALCSVLNIWFT
ncbi:MAG: hypothetical protein Q8N47_28015 [Bryobacterales bacterium]|nr:hypothetical protein [Bryobacterales bacterium]